MNKRKMHDRIRSFIYTEGRTLPLETVLVLEAPLEIVINDTRRILIMCTPGMIRELVFGFLFTEGFVRDVSQVDQFDLKACLRPGGDEILEASVRISGWTERLGGVAETGRSSYSSCGICGRDGFDNLAEGLGRVKSRQRFAMEVILTLPEKLSRLQPLYERTGGAHAAVVFDKHGAPVLRSEDMGRHNALDKVIGAALLEGVPREDKVLLSSGRASLEMILKTVRAGFPVFVALSRPTSRAVEAAKFYNVTLIDMAKDSNRIYSHVRRVDPTGS